MVTAGRVCGQHLLDNSPPPRCELPHSQSIHVLIIIALIIKGIFYYLL